MGIASAVTAGAGLVGSVVGATTNHSSTTAQTQNQNTQQNSSKTPWAPQASSFQTGLTANDALYRQLAAEPAYSGQLYAGQNQTQTGAQAQALGYTSGIGANSVNAAADVGNSLTPWSQAYGNNANQIAANGIGYQQNSGLTGALSNIGSGAQGAVNSGLSSTLNNAAVNGAQSVGQYNAGLQGIMKQGESDPTQRIAADAGQYANSAAVQGQIGNANAQIQNTLNETTVPGLNRQAAAGGDLNSSRAGAAEAQANTGAALAESNADSQIYANAYNTGMSTASGQYSNGLNTALSAGVAGLSGNSNLALGTANNQIGATNTQVNAANSGLSNALSYSQANTGDQLAGNAQMLAGVNTGLSANNQAGALAAGNYSMAGGIGQTDQTDAQNSLASQYQAYQIHQQYQQGLLTNYMNTANIPQGYGNTTSTSTSNGTTAGSATAAPNYGGLAAGGIAAGGALYNSVYGSGANSNPFA